MKEENYDFLTECNFFSLKVQTDEKDSENNTKGIRHSIIYFIHTTFFYHNNYKAEIECDKWANYFY